MPERSPSEATASETLILVHRRERAHKCSVQPLRGRPGFQFHTYPHPLEISLENHVRLGFGGPLIGPEDQKHALLILDATWRLAGRMENVYRDVPVRSLPPCETAYPRVSKREEDPMGGLATIEAIYLAYLLMGRDTTGLLDEYHWGDEFLRRNDHFRHLSPQSNKH